MNENNFRSAAEKDISALLSDFRAKRALGLGSLFGDHQLEGLSCGKAFLNILVITLLLHGH